MNKITDSSKSFLQFSRGEWSGIMVILLVITGLYAIAFFLPHYKQNTTDFKEFQNEVARFQADQERIADSIEQYRSLNYQNNYKSNYYTYNNKNYRHDSLSSKPFVKQEKKREYDIVKLDINTCDSLDIMRVPQFGAKRAKKVIEYRTKLGGFYSLHQIKEIYILQNIDDELLTKYFVINKSGIHKINVNKATYKEMISHPYFDVYLTKTILNYRQKNGPIRSVDEFKRITNAYPELMEKLTPYLSF